MLALGVIAAAWWRPSSDDGGPGAGTARPAPRPSVASAGGPATSATTPSAAPGAPSTAPTPTTPLPTTPAPSAPAAKPPPGTRLPYTEDDSLLLSKEKRALIWEEENHYHQLLTKVFPGWEAGLRTADAAAYRAAAAPAFEARVGVLHAAPAWERAGAVRVATATGTPDRDPPTDADGFVDALLAVRRELATATTAKWAITSLRPLDAAAWRTGGWEGRFQLDLRGTLPSGARAETNVKCRVRTGPLAADLRGATGWLRALEVLSVRRVAAADPAAPGPLLEDVTARSGLPADLHDNWAGGPWQRITGGVFVEDFDLDGVLDVLVTDLRRVALMRGRGDLTFEDRTAAAGLPTRLHGAGPQALAADFDGDGAPDLVLAGRVWRNRGDGTFDDLGDRASLPLPQGLTNLVALDYDGDGRMDVYAATAGGRGGVMHSSWIDDRAHPPNELLRNLGGFKFQNVTAATGVGDRGASFAAVAFDHDGDRFPDLFVANEVGQNALYLNDGAGPFRRVDPDGTRWGGFSMGVDTGDVDGDGTADVYVADMYSKAGSRIIGLVEPSDYPPGLHAKVVDFVTGNRLHVRGDGRGGFREVGQEVGVHAAGWAYGVRVADFDGDGALDLYSTAGHKSVTRTEPDG